jgi:hypothetical protein
MLSYRVPSCFAVSSIYECLPMFINNKSIVVLITDTSILCTHSHATEFNANTQRVIEIINIWFKDNYLSLNFEKKTHIQSKTME